MEWHFEWPLGHGHWGEVPYVGRSKRTGGAAPSASKAHGAPRWGRPGGRHIAVRPWGAPIYGRAA